MGINGHKCLDCDSNFNTMWSSITMQFWDGKCPICSSKNVVNLPLVVDAQASPKGLPKFNTYFLDKFLETIEQSGVDRKLAENYKKWLPEYADRIDAVTLKDSVSPRGLFSN